MANKSVINMINEALQLHFIRKTKYKIEHLAIEDMNNNKNNKVELNVVRQTKPIVTFLENGRSYETEVFGLYTNKYKTFSWSWSLPSNFYGSSKLSKKLFDFYYEKDIDTEYDIIDFFLRNIFITSRLEVRDMEEMEMIIAVSEYVLKETNNFKFIFPVKKMLSSNINDFIIIYYFAKFSD